MQNRTCSGLSSRHAGHCTLRTSSVDFTRPVVDRGPTGSGGPRPAGFRSRCFPIRTGSSQVIIREHFFIRHIHCCADRRASIDFIVKTHLAFHLSRNPYWLVCNWVTTSRIDRHAGRAVTTRAGHGIGVVLQKRDTNLSKTESVLFLDASSRGDVRLPSNGFR